MHVNIWVKADSLFHGPCGAVEEAVPHILVPARLQELLQLGGRDAVKLVEDFWLRERRQKKDKQK